MTTALSGDAVAIVRDLAQQAATAEIAIDGKHFAHLPFFRAEADPRQPQTREFYTLQGFADFVSKTLAQDYVSVHVVSPVCVEAISKLYGDDDHLRDVWGRAVCKTATIAGFKFNQTETLEGLAIALQTCFDQSQGDIVELRRFCASVKSTAELGIADDGMSQEVHARIGIAAVTTTPVKNPWSLAPWRTFSEIPQPVSSYVLRFRREDEEPAAALFETGDASWQVDAVKRIAQQLRVLLGPDFIVLG